MRKDIFLDERITHMTDKDFSIDTKLIHAGEPNPRIKGAVSMPIFQSSNFEYEGETSYDSIRYIRLNNTPNHILIFFCHDLGITKKFSVQVLRIFVFKIFQIIKYFFG